ncbi:unnamed protein product [Darwinula stevensoni]|uniref:Formin-binding protein 1-like n=1 Tax=Darwinula stevensoni TaxID=69355 RepID=A0A7R8XAY8_9CRUS|nr:unnamed protein product [Darwinula stevensoni]CAG0887195.1 unnamed protein product [Darwinula stevensoni]
MEKGGGLVQMYEKWLDCVEDSRSLSLSLYPSCGCLTARSMALDCLPNDGGGMDGWLDQYENIAAHTQKGIEFLEKLGGFIRERCAVETDYAAKLRRLVKKYQPNKKEEEDLQFSSCRAFRGVLGEVGDLAGQHEVIAENLSSSVAQNVASLVKSFKEERKKDPHPYFVPFPFHFSYLALSLDMHAARLMSFFYSHYPFLIRSTPAALKVALRQGGFRRAYSLLQSLQEGARLQAVLQAQQAALERSKKAYEKAFKEAEKASENFQKADADLNLSRAEVEKHRILFSRKTQESEDTKNEYASQLQRTNELQHQHFAILMPSIFSQLQEIDEKRTASVKTYLKKSVEVEKAVFPIIDKCLEGIIKAADSINEVEDSKLVVERYKSGFTPPEDIPFEDLSAMKNGEYQSASESNSQEKINMSGNSEKKSGRTLRGTLSATRMKKRGGIFGIFGSAKNHYNSVCDQKEDWADLPPNQRKKKIQQRIDELTAKIQQETAARDGILKMKEVYESNPAMGDSASLTGELAHHGKKIDFLRHELQQYQTMLDEVPFPSNQPPSRNPSTRLTNHINGRTHQSDRHSLSDQESLSRSASDSSVSNPASSNQNPSNSNQTSLHGSNNSRESGLGTSHMSIPDSDPDAPQEEDEIDFYEDPNPLPVLGTGRALYQFDALSEGSIPMHAGETVHIVEVDQGDGWTRVRRMDKSEEGFVPTSYMEISLYTTC